MNELKPNKNNKLKEKYICVITINNYIYYSIRIRKLNFQKLYNIHNYNLDYVVNIRNYILNNGELIS